MKKDIHNKTIKITMFICLIFITVFLFYYFSQAKTYKNISSMRAKAWMSCEWNPLKGICDDFPTEQNITGAVSSSGKVLCQIKNWDSQAIPTENNDIPVYFRSTGSDKIAVLSSDCLVTVLKKDGKRSYIQSGKIVGYVETKLLSFGDDAKNIADKRCPLYLITDYTNVKIYQKSSDSSKLLSVMEQRKLYSINKLSKGWYSINISDDDKNKTGYVSSDKTHEVRSIAVAKYNSIESYTELYQTREASQNDRKLLAALVYCEAESESFKGQQAVAEVILNRRDSDVFPNTIKDVIYESKQFEPVTSGKLDSVLNNDKEIPDSCYEAVDSILQGKIILKNSLYFDTSGNGTQIGNHWFR